MIRLMIILILICAGCAKPVEYTQNKSLLKYDKDTEYSIQELCDGFTISVYYSRYQFIPESSSVASSCKGQLTSIAWEYAERLGKKIDLNEQRIKLSMGRNGFTGITSCQGVGVAKWIE